jgi:hypothetical protein
MRSLLAALAGILGAAIGAALGLIASENTRPQQVTILGTTMHGSAGTELAAATGVGFFLALLILVPRLLASAGLRRSLSERRDAMELQLHSLRTAHAQLQRRYRHVLTEHQRMLATVPAPMAPEPSSLPPPALGASRPSGAEPSTEAPVPLELQGVSRNQPTLV